MTTDFFDQEINHGRAAPVFLSFFTLPLSLFKNLRRHEKKQAIYPFIHRT
jgi:hypothetical protein